MSYEIEGSVQDGQEFNVNDPALLAWTPDEDENTEGEPERVVQEPPEGNIMIRVKLREPKEDKPTLKPYVSSKHGNGISAMLSAQELRWNAETEEWSEGQFLKDVWASTVRFMDSETIAKLTLIMKRAGSPFGPKMSIGEKLEHAKQVFEEAENGVDLPAYVRWNKSVLKLDEYGEPVVDDRGNKVYIEIKGRKKIKDAAAKKAKAEGVELGLTGEELKEHIARAEATAHIYEDADGTERTVRAEVDRFLSQDEWDKHLQREATKAAKAAAAQTN
jgi:hypothetical protein